MGFEESIKNYKKSIESQRADKKILLQKIFEDGSTIVDFNQITIKHKKSFYI
ncbi:MAG: hypothetical protein ISR65_12765 [Bacteriovoracaceae bacterium]|nr:hypothetical protein [Bacteriovoracaceae bacterium]